MDVQVQVLYHIIGIDRQTHGYIHTHTNIYIYNYMRLSKAQFNKHNSAQPSKKSGHILLSRNPADSGILLVGSDCK